MVLNAKIVVFLLAGVGITVTGWVVYLHGGINPGQLQLWLKQAGNWAPFCYVLLYVMMTIVVLPSTPLNLVGGAMFGPWWGLAWTSIGALLAAIVSFTFTRTIGRKAIAQRLAGRWQAMDAEVQNGGLFYLFAIRLVPVMPYGLVNFAAGLTAVSFKDYLLGTALGTVPSVLPFVLLGSYGMRAVQTRDVLPLVGALTLTGILVAGSTWYRRHVVKRGIR